MLPFSVDKSKQSTIRNCGLTYGSLSLCWSLYFKIIGGVFSHIAINNETISNNVFHFYQENGCIRVANTFESGV